MSLLSWERGLKSFDHDCGIDDGVVAPLVGAWIEITILETDGETNTSLLSWERGLKYSNIYRNPKPLQSLLSWERGLKYPAPYSIMHMYLVAPLVGAWIEISTRTY